MSAATAAGSAPHPAIAFTRSNNETIDVWPQALASIRVSGLSVLIVEYPGVRPLGGQAIPEDDHGDDASSGS